MSYNKYEYEKSYITPYSLISNVFGSYNENNKYIKYNYGFKKQKTFYNIPIIKNNNKRKKKFKKNY